MVSLFLNFKSFKKTQEEKRPQEEKKWPNINYSVVDGLKIVNLFPSPIPTNLGIVLEPQTCEVYKILNDFTVKTKEVKNTTNISVKKRELGLKEDQLQFLKHLNATYDIVIIPPYLNEVLLEKGVKYLFGNFCKFTPTPDTKKARVHKKVLDLSNLLV